MTMERERHLERRDRALRDLVELDRQVLAGELSTDDEQQLRDGYERDVATALQAVERLDADAAATAVSPSAVAEHRGRRGRATRLGLYGAGFSAVVVAGLLLPGNLLDRPEGGFVTGNEALENPGAAQPAPASEADLSKVTDAEMEAVIAANPEVIGMRLALADRYTASGQYDLAAVHYRKVLEQDPSNPQGKASLGWLMFQLGESDQAARLVDEALQTAPELVVGWWYKANIRLYGFDDPGGAISALDTLRARPQLSPEVRDQVETLRQEALDVASR